jgi:hypothetical protein
MFIRLNWKYFFLISDIILHRIFLCSFEFLISDYIHILLKIHKRKSNRGVPVIEKFFKFLKSLISKNKNWLVNSRIGEKNSLGLGRIRNWHIIKNFFLVLKIVAISFTVWNFYWSNMIYYALWQKYFERKRFANF